MTIDGISMTGLVQEVAFVLLVVYCLICFITMVQQQLRPIVIIAKANVLTSTTPVAMSATGSKHVIVRLQRKESPAAAMTTRRSTEKLCVATHPAQHSRNHVPGGVCPEPSLHALQTDKAKASSGSRFYANVVTAQQLSFKRLKHSSSTQDTISSQRGMMRRKRSLSDCQACCALLRRLLAGKGTTTTCPAAQGPDTGNLVYQSRQPSGAACK